MLLRGLIFIKNGKYYYLFASIGSCCNGVNSFLSSGSWAFGKTFLGPYVDKRREGYA